MAGRSRSSRASHPSDQGRALGVDEMLALAKRVTDATGAPLVGGLAVVLHGWGRYTRAIDIYSDDFASTHQKLLDAGIRWNAERREHVIDGVPIHMVAEDSLGGPPKRVNTIEGVNVIGLADLIRRKLTVGLESIHRATDIADVIELIRMVPLKKDFAPRLPKHLRSAFKEMVEQVHGPRRTTMPSLRFWKKYA